MDTQSRFMQFDPPPLLRSPHMQTLLSSRLVRGFSSAGQALLERAETIIVPCGEGVRLQALANMDAQQRQSDAGQSLQNGVMAATEQLRKLETQRVQQLYTARVFEAQAELSNAASEGNLEAFESSPTRYVPRFGGFCAFGVSVGKKFDGDPLVYKLHEGKLYLNLNPEIAGMFEEDVPGNVAKAVDHWATIHDKAPADL